MSRVRKDGHHGAKPRKVGVAEDGRTIWECRVRCGLRRDGKPKERSERFTGTYQEAVDHTDHMWRIYSAMPDEISKITLEEYFYDHFVPERLDRGPKKTKKDYVSIFKNHVLPIFGKRYPDSISHREIQQWLYSIQSPNDRKVYRHFRAVMRAMFDDEYLDTKPLERRPRFGRYQKSRKDVWSAKELAEAMTRIRGHPLERAFLVMGGGGLRREEAFALIAPNDFHFETEEDELGQAYLICYTDVTKAFTNDDGLKDEKTFSPYTAAIMPPFSNRLAELMPDEPEPLVICQRKMRMREDDPRMFDGCKRASMYPDSASGMWRCCFEGPWVSTRTRNGRVTSTKEMPAGPLYGMRYIEFNHLRHTHVTLTLQGGVSEAVSAKAHGHNEVVEYRHYFSDRGTAKKAAESFTKQFNKAS